MSVAALISLLGGPMCKEVDAIMERSLMDRMPQHCEAITNLCKSNHTIIVNSCGEATAIIANLPDTSMEERKNLCICLWTNLVQHINGLKCLNMYKLMTENIKALIKIVSVEYLSFFCVIYVNNVLFLQANMQSIFTVSVALTFFIYNISAYNIYYPILLYRMLLVNR